MNRKQIGRKGGTKIAQVYGHEYLREIGKRGGEAMKQKLEDPHAYYSALGKIGGETTKKRKSNLHFSYIGRIGGSK